MISGLNNSPIIVVVFNNDPTPQLFGSVAAIFDEYTTAQVGCNKYDVYRGLLSKKVTTDRCTIYRCFVHRKPQRKHR